MRALVIGGGGSKAAFAGGVAHFLIQEEKRAYDILIGTAAGGVMIPQFSLENLEKIKNVFTNMEQKDVFSQNPFLFHSNKKGDYVSINYYNTFCQFIKRKRTFGESLSLKNFILEKFTFWEYQQILDTHKDVVVTVTNLTKNRVEYKSIRECSYEEFCEWLWISCNMVPFMSLAKKNGDEYGNGGLGCVIPIVEAINRGAKEIDVIVLETEEGTARPIAGKNPFSLMSDMFGFLVENTQKHDLTLGKLMAENRGVLLNVYYTPAPIQGNALLFKPKHMKSLWQQGFNYAKEKAMLKQENLL